MSRPLHALLLPTGQRLFDALASALDGGPAIAPLAPDVPAAQLRRTLDALRPHVVITEQGASRPGLDPVAVDDATAVVVSTSGSTGAPKGVELSAEALRHSAAAALSRVDARPGDRWLCCVPAQYIGGLQVLTRSLVAGTEPEIHARFAVDAVAASDAEFVAMVPTMLHRLVEAGTPVERFRAIVLGGAAAPPSLLERAVAKGATVIVAYGMSETSGGCVYDGVPLDGVSVSLAAGGRVRIRGPVLASGYRFRPQETDEAFTADGFVTNDLGELGADGRLRVIGRVDDVVNTGGRKVAATRVADRLAEHRDVREVAVFGRHDPEWGQRIVAVVVPRDMNAPPELGQLRRHVENGLASYAAPRELIVVAALPCLPSGKVDRRALDVLAPGEVWRR